MAAVRRRLLDADVDTADEDARLLLRAATGLTSLELATQQQSALTPEQSLLLEQYVTRREAHEPVSRILGSRGFWTVDLLVTPNVLDPRPDTETLIETALSLVENKPNAPLKILELGAGSGAIACALLSELPKAEAIIVDLSPHACKASQANLARCGLSNRAFVLQAWWYEAIQAQFDLIISNPPYVASTALNTLPPSVRLYDPLLALDGGEDGLDCYRAIIQNLPRVLKSRGLVIFELGCGQAADVRLMLETMSLQVEKIARDLGGHERALAARAPKRDLHRI
ncbi:MAG: peptide chain release factor N(5)-glutamine methyltransferase [Methylocystis sp.]